MIAAFFIFLGFFIFKCSFIFLFFFRNHLIPLHLESRSALQQIKGIGWWKSFVICSKLGMMFPFFLVDLRFYPFFLSWLFLFFIRFFVLPLDTVVRKIKRRFKVLLSMNCFRSFRHRDKMPVRGQRTRSNAGTMRILRQRVS